MKYFFLIFFVLAPALAVAEIDLRPITRNVNVNTMYDDLFASPVTWSLGESIRYDVFARDGRTPLDLSGPSVPVLLVTASDNSETVYLAKTGTVINATQGHVRITLTAEEALLPTNQIFTAFVNVYRTVSTDVVEVVTIDYTALRVLPNPAGIQYTVMDPLDPPFVFNIDFTGFTLSWSNIVGAPSVFPADLTAFTTDDVTEGTNNLYFTDGLAVTAIKADPDWLPADWNAAFSWGDHAGLYELAGSVAALSNALSTAAFTLSSDYEVAGSVAALSNALGSAAFTASSAYDPAGTAASAVGSLSNALGTAAFTQADTYELVGAASALSNALGTAAFANTDAFDPAGAANTVSTNLGARLDVVEAWGDHGEANYLTTAYAPAIADVTGLQSALDDKANLTLVTDLSNRVDTVEGWGDHAAAGYATTGTVAALDARVGTVEGWGDHALAGYASTGSVAALEGRVDTVEGWGDHAGLYRLIDYVPGWDDITDKPSTFPPSSHSHIISDITDLQATLDEKAAVSNLNALVTRVDTVEGWGDHAGLYLPTNTVITIQDIPGLNDALLAVGSTQAVATIEARLTTLEGFGDHATNNYAFVTDVTALSNALGTAAFTAASAYEASGAAAALSNALGTAAFLPSTDFDPAGSASNAVGTLSNLLGTAAFTAATDYELTGAAAALSNALGTAAFTAADAYEIAGAAAALSNTLGSAAFIDAGAALASAAIRGMPATNSVAIATNILIDANFSNTTYALPFTGLHSIEVVSDIPAGTLFLDVCKNGESQSFNIPGGTNTLFIGSECATNVTLNVSLAPPNSDFTNNVFAINATGYLFPDVVGVTNDFRANPVMVRQAQENFEPVSLGQLNQVVAAIRVDRWSDNVAVSPVDLNGNQLRFGENFTAVGADETLTFNWNNNPFMRFYAGASGSGLTGQSQIVSFSITSNVVTLGVEVTTGWEPSPQWTDDLIDTNSWQDITPFTSTYPTQTYGVVTLVFDEIVSTNTIYYRAVITEDTPAVDSILEITADKLQLLGRRFEILDTNANTVVTIDAETGLTVGTATTVIGPTGDIIQSATNSADFGLVSIGRLTNNLLLSAQSGAPGYSTAILMPNTAAGATNRLSSYAGDLYFYDPADTNRLLGWPTRIVTEGSLAAGLFEGGLRIGTNSFTLAPNGDLDANWNLGGYTVSNGVFVGDGAGLTNLNIGTMALASTNDYFMTNDVTDLLLPLATIASLSNATDRIDLLEAGTNDWNAAYAATTNLGTMAYVQTNDYYTSAEIDADFVSTNSANITIDGVTLDGGTLTASALVASNFNSLSNNATGTWSFEALQVGTNAVLHAGNFNASAYVTAASLVNTLTNYARRVSVPGSNTASGVVGQYAVSGSHAYFYVPESNKWGRVALDLEW